MDITLVLNSAIIATSAMTVFSYIYSSIVNRQFSEPELLNMLLTSWSSEPQVFSKTSLLCWLIHYFVGLFFMVIFYFIWNQLKFEVSWTAGLLFDFLAGIIGVIGWHLTFWIHPNPPTLDFKHYYGHLILAHIIFGISGSFSSNWLN